MGANGNYNAYKDLSRADTERWLLEFWEPLIYKDKTHMRSDGTGKPTEKIKLKMRAEQNELKYVV